MDWPDGADDTGVVTITSTHPTLSIGRFLVGMSSPVNAASAVWPSANLAIFVPFTPPCHMTVVKMFTLNGATAAGTQDLSVYDSNGSQLIPSSSTAQTGTSTMQVHDVTDTVLEPGCVSYLALSNTLGTGTYLRIAPAFKQICGAAGILQMAAAAPLPATATFAAAGFPYVPMFGLTARVLT